VRRADRLFRLIQRLRRTRGVTTAAQLAAALEVSERTVYRDVRDLILSGVPVKGEAGVGYALDRSFDLPPLMFDEQELEALVLGARVAAAWADPRLAAAAQEALQKIEAVLPPPLRERLLDTALVVPDFHVGPKVTAGLQELREAIRERRKLLLRYLDKDGSTSARQVRPLGLSFWGKSWTLIAWCELREDFRSFRTDRIAKLRVTRRRFEAEPGRTLKDFIVKVEAEEKSVKAGPGVLTASRAGAAAGVTPRAAASAARSSPSAPRGDRGRRASDS
jgi:predicted DNA-binding transcriptional regulator YafY